MKYTCPSTASVSLPNSGYITNVDVDGDFPVP